MKKITEKYPFFLVLLPTFVLIHFEKEFSGVINYEFIYDRMIILFAMPVIAFLFFYLFLRSVQPSSLMAFAFLTFFYYTGDLRNWLMKTFPGSLWWQYKFLLPLFLLLLLLLFFWLKRTRFDLRRHCFVINMALILFITADIVQMMLGSPGGKIISEEANIKNTPCDSCIKPDIYYIIFDAYTSSKQLKEEFGYNNRSIEEDLEKKGFKIIKDSKSNYNYTTFSLASVFNMNYMKDMDTTYIIQNRPYFQSLKLVHDNAVFSFLQKENYEIFNYSFFDIRSFPAATERADVWDMKKLFDQYNLFFKLYRDLDGMLPAKARGLLDTKFAWNNPETRRRFDSTVYNGLQNVIKLQNNRPKFVYAHFMRPHPFYHFDSTGHRFNSGSISNKEAYIHQIAYANRIIKNITDSLISYTGRQKVVIIQGDHGNKDTQEKPGAFTNFNAFYFSNNDYHLLNDSITNVNTFRIVLNTFFDKKLELLPDRFCLMFQK